MPFKKFKAWCCFILLFLAVLPAGFSAEEPSIDQFAREVTPIKSRLTEIEKAQTDLLRRQDQALKEIDQIRKWIAKG